MINEFSTGWIVTLSIAAVWELAWKSFALWRASKRDEKGWFAALLIINTVGILPIVYLLSTRRKHVEAHTEYQTAQ